MLNSTGTTANNYLYAGEQYDSDLDKSYNRARYYDMSIGRFTAQDVWQGRMNNPVTLNKYLYAHSDPVNGTDPSGYLTLSDIGAAVRVMGNLATRSISRSRDLFSTVIQGGGNAARGAGQILIRSGKYLKNIAKKCKSSKSKDGNACTYAKGFTEAEAKVHALVARTPNSRKKSKHPAVVVVGAFDIKKGRGTAAFNGPYKTPAPGMAKHLRKYGLSYGQENACGTTNTVGQCAEFRSANMLLRSGSKLKHVRWTQAYRVTKGPGGHLKIQKEVGYCNICQTLGAGK